MLKLTVPRLEDLWFREEFMSDKATMSYNKNGVEPLLFQKQIGESGMTFG